MSFFTKPCIVLLFAFLCSSSCVRAQCEKDHLLHFGTGFGTGISSMNKTACLHATLDGTIWAGRHLEASLQLDRAGNLPFSKYSASAARVSFLAGYRFPAGGFDAVSLLAGPEYFTGRYSNGKVRSSGSWLSPATYAEDTISGLGLALQLRIEMYANPIFCFVLMPFADISARSQAGVSVRFLFGNIRRFYNHDQHRQ